MSAKISEPALAQLFDEARTFNKFQKRPVERSLLEQLYEHMRWAPTSMNCQPARFVFLTSSEAKEALKPALSGGNKEKTMNAPVVVIIAFDTQFYQHLPSQFPAVPDAGESYSKDSGKAYETAFRNGTLQGAYFIMAARSMGLDCGPMSGFDAAQVNDLYFSDGRYRVNFIVNLGYGDPSGNHPRGPRLSLADVAEFR